MHHPIPELVGFIKMISVDMELRGLKCERKQKKKTKQNAPISTLTKKKKKGRMPHMR